MIFSNRGARNTVCLNTSPGPGHLQWDCRDITPASGIADTKVSNAVAVGNFAPGFGSTPDTNLDVVFANDGPNEVCLGTGDWSGTNVGFNCSKYNTTSTYTESDATAHTSSVAVADVLPTYAGDEILFANSDSFNLYCLYTFTCSTAFQPTQNENVVIGGTTYSVVEPVPEATTGIAAADVNGDGKLDVVVANVGVSRTYLGLFTEVDANATLAPTSVTLGDVGFGGDTTPPVISAAGAPLGPLYAEATGPAGAVVTFNVTAVDAVDGSVPVTCNPSAGSTFPVGDTT